MAESVSVSGTAAIDREAAFSRFVAGRLPGAYRTASLILGDAAEAEDATQDALVRAWRAWGSVRDPARVDAWFDRILVNVCRTRLRSRRSRPAEVFVPGIAGDPASWTAERELLWSALRALSPEHRITLVLRFYLDLSVEDVAARTGTREGTVKSRLHYALSALRAALEATERGAEETAR